mgnify:CR=1 FL=1
MKVQIVQRIYTQSNPYDEKLTFIGKFKTDVDENEYTNKGFFPYIALLNYFESTKHDIPNEVEFQVGYNSTNLVRYIELVVNNELVATLNPYFIIYDNSSECEVFETWYDVCRVYERECFEVPRLIDDIKVVKHLDINQHGMKNLLKAFEESNLQ